MEPGWWRGVIEFPAGGALSATDVGRGPAPGVRLEGKLQLDVGGMHELLETGDCACLESEMALAGARPESTAAGFWRYTGGERAEG